MTGLLLDDRGRCELAGSMGTTARRLHRCGRGNISILVLCMGLVFYAMTAMIWNTGMVASAKVETQTAADAAAYSAAVWTSRGMNLTTATNMLILRNCTAFAAATSCILPSILDLPIAASKISSFCGTVFSFFPPAIPVCWNIFFWFEFSQWATFMVQWTPGLAHLPLIIARVIELHLFQRELWQTAIPEAILQTRDAMEDYYGCEINLKRADNGPLTHPVVPGIYHGGTGFLAPYTFRALYELYGDDNGWYNATPVDLMIWGQFSNWYAISSIGTIPAGFALGAAAHMVPTTQTGPLEWGPEAFDQWDSYTVIATARKRDDNSAGEQPPRYPLRFMAGGLFSEPVNPVAYAQAETFNGIDGWEIPMMYWPLPWRVWTTYGWQWQPRLSHGNPSGGGAQGDSLLPNVAVPVFDFAPDGRVIITNTNDVRRIATH